MTGGGKVAARADAASPPKGPSARTSKVSNVPARGLDAAPPDPVAGAKCDGAGGGEVAVLREYGPFRTSTRRRLGDDEVEVGVALAVAVGTMLTGTPSTEIGDVGAVVGVEAAQEDLLRLAAAGVLRDDQPRNDPEQVLGGHPRPKLDVELADTPARRRPRRPDRRRR